MAQFQNVTTPLTNDPLGNLAPGPVVDYAQRVTPAAAYITQTAASAGVNGADLQNYEARGVKVVINISAITGTGPTYTVTIQGKDVASGQYYTLLASAALNATGTTVLTVFPGAPASANVSANDALPANWRIITAVAGTTPAVTATISFSTVA